MATDPITATADAAEPSSPPTWTGWSERQARGDLVTAFLLGLMGLGLLVATRQPLELGLGLAVAAMLLAAGSRDAVHVEPSGLWLVRRRLWALRSAERYPLDCRLGVYKGPDEHEPSGLCIIPPERAGDAPLSAPFGPGGSRKRRAAALAALTRALESVRAALPTSAELRHPLLEEQRAALDLEGARRSEQGRLVEIEATAPVVLPGLRLPAGSVLRLNGPDFVDPTRPDELRGAVVGPGGAELPGGLSVPEGAEVALAPDGRPQSARAEGDEIVELAGWRLRLDGGVALDPEGGLRSGVLAESVVLDGVRLPKSSRLRFLSGVEVILGHALNVEVSETVRLPELQVLTGEVLVFDRERRLVGLRVGARYLRVDGWRVKGGAMLVPLTPEHRLDLEGCKRAGLAQRELS